MSIISRLKSGLAKSSGRITEGISAIFSKRKLDAEMLAELEELLIVADVGAETAAEIVAEIGKERLGKDISVEEVKAALAEKIAARLKPSSINQLLSGDRPSVVLVVGVNGNGKTTTIGKLAARFKASGNKVMLAACDTFRAAAVEQLQEWGRRSDIEVITGATGSDPASVAFAAYEQAIINRADILLIDTAGRLHNKANLMQELHKIARVLKKLNPAAPHHSVMVLDATTGQNAVSQLAAFREIVQVSGLVVTKLDGTAKGGIVLALAGKFAIPIHAIGLGEGIEDLQDFHPVEFSKNLVGL